MRSKSIKYIAITMVMMLVFSMMPVSVFAATKTKKMTLYTEVIKSGKYAYCCTPNGVYKVNLKTKTKKLIVSDENFEMYPPDTMKLYKGYLFYTAGGGTGTGLHRVKTNGKNNKGLTSICSFAISKNKIYYTEYDFGNGGSKRIKKVMKLNGKGKKKSSYNVVNTLKKSNKKGYRVKTFDSVIYLITPNKKKIKLGTLMYNNW